MSVTIDSIVLLTCVERETTWAGAKRRFNSFK